MKVFISWSGDLSKRIATALKEWIPNVLQSTEPYVSSEDIDKGSRWSTDIAKELADSTYGILCVTRDNFREPWLNFEAGALSKKMESSRVCPFLYNVKLSEIDGPLLQFQVTVYKKQDVLKLLISLNNSCTDQKLPEERLLKAFELWWPELERNLKIEDVDLIQQGVNNESNNAHNDAILEEILSLLQTQQKILRRPEEILPPDYIIDLMKKSEKDRSTRYIAQEAYYELFEVYERLRIASIDNLKFLRLVEGINKEILMRAETIDNLCENMERPISYMQRRVLKRKSPDNLLIIE
ncbi:TIR domain-containing protein [Methanosarcina mazei]|uniref:TIR domain-containing protein n=3 Tax=Methanosarcina mazei TaxID=2209 RepID=A0A0F8FL93_METMZ|nr:TIR domain-containing protein [Methanosarcina mazei]AKB72189.1 hypothetical protein MSMAC_2299 [Methanosarcina mazei C16]KKG27768.1 hypothetical protein DU49_15135 [Methanosarcina mazei]KKG40537.1 hypothetical protein DU41_15275 [Methanosarcina mazei]KKG41980.1 hypothetical protein DU35_18680 [Methanosarcina mazei]KKG46482.1 hypothetical protein DU39_15600 [Methanosarcina mazei]